MPLYDQGSGGGFTENAPIGTVSLFSQKPNDMWIPRDGSLYTVGDYPKLDATPGYPIVSDPTAFTGTNTVTSLTGLPVNERSRFYVSKNKELIIRAKIGVWSNEYSIDGGLTWVSIIGVVRIVSACVYDDNNIACLSNDGFVYLFNITTKILTKYASVTHGSVIASEFADIIAVTPNKVIVVGLSNGRIVYTLPGDLSAFYLAAPTGNTINFVSVVYFNGYIYFTQTNGTVLMNCFRTSDFEYYEQLDQKFAVSSTYINCISAGLKTIVIYTRNQDRFYISEDGESWRILPNTFGTIIGAKRIQGSDDIYVIYNASDTSITQARITFDGFKTVVTTNANLKCVYGIFLSNITNNIVFYESPANVVPNEYKFSINVPSDAKMCSTRIDVIDGGSKYYVKAK